MTPAADPVDASALTALRAHAEYLRRFTLAGGGEVLDEQGVLCLCSPHPLPYLVNTAMRTRASVEPAMVIDTSIAFFAARDRGFDLVGLVGRDDDLLDALAADGQTLGEPEPLQHLDLAELAPTTAPAGIELQPVSDADGVRDVAAVNRDATSVYDMPDDLFPTLFSEPETVLMDGMRAIVAYDGGAPVATAQVHLTGDAAYLGWVAVARSAMRRGLGMAVSAAVLEQAAAAGARSAVLMASPMGAPLYRRMGFVDVGAIRSALLGHR